MSFVAILSPIASSGTNANGFLTLFQKIIQSSVCVVFDGTKRTGSEIVVSVQSPG